MIEVGKKARAFTAKDQDGETHSLRDYLGQWIVLYFYPKDSTPGCTKEACQFSDLLPDFDGINAAVFGVSPDTVESHEKFAAHHDLTFPLLADPKDANGTPKICEKYGVWKQKKNYGRTYMGVVRTTYLIDPDGKIAHRFDKVRADGHAAKVLEVLNELQEEA